MEQKSTRPLILVVDDEEDLLNLMEITLRREGYDVHLCPGGHTLEKCMESNRPDIVLLDIRMAGVDGGEICRNLKSDPETSDIPIILFSANDNIEKIARECGADDYLIKPFEPSVAREKFKNILATHH
jgi:CheY-like chemotaxis protein